MKRTLFIAGAVAACCISGWLWAKVADWARKTDEPFDVWED